VGSSPSAADEAREGAARLRSIRDALGSGDPSQIDPETQSLMLRQLAVSRLEAGRLDEALELAGRIVRMGVLSDLGHHEAARVHSVRGDHLLAAAAELLAARAAPADRRAFFWWSLATHFDHAGETDRALDALRRASRWATDAGRPLYRAHAAALRLGAGRPVRDLSSVVKALEASPQREGYGRYLLGLIAHRTGDEHALSHLRAFVRRHASSERAVVLTLSVELKAARQLIERLDPSMV
jgi:tetratricopeptide (TPR) repeat protein